MSTDLIIRRLKELERKSVAALPIVFANMVNELLHPAPNRHIEDFEEG